MKAVISDMKRFAVHDGPGVRTTVFFKGCPLNCVWCHNPESIGFSPETAFYANKCRGCMACAAVCPQGAHTCENGVHVFQKTLCVGCGKCEESCLWEALKFYGEEVTVESLLPRLLEDRDFYETSGGGVTLSGGECLCQADFCAALLKELKENGIHTAVDTCGFVPQTALEKVMPYTDLFLYDIKAIDEEVHIRCTGQSNRRILENLQYLDACGKAVEIRIPYVPHYNDTQPKKIAAFLKPLTHITAVKVLPYHNFAGSKYAALQRENTLPPILPTEEEMAAAERLFI